MINYLKKTASSNWLSYLLPTTLCLHFLVLLIYVENPASIHHVIQIILLSIEAIIALLIIFYSWMISRFVRSMQHFRETAKRLGADIYTPLEIEDESYVPPVIRETTYALQSMQTRLQELLKDRSRLLAAISHDLRTPITRMKLRAHLMEHTVSQQKMLADLQEMEKMINEIMLFAKLEHFVQQKIKVDLDSILKTICDEMADMGASISYSCKTKPLLIQGDPISLKRALTNLINNALKYGHHADVQAKQLNKCIKIIISDQGQGINEHEMQQVFMPFYRGDTSRSRDSADVGGSGLGLTIARDTIMSHQGNIELKNREGGGLQVIVKLPRFSLNSI